MLICQFNPETMRCIWNAMPDSTYGIAFRYGDGRLLARLICWWRGGDSAHCEIVAGVTDAGDQTSHCISASWVDGGVRHKPIRLAPEKWRIYSVPCESSPWEWLREHEGAPYDFLGLLSFVVSVVRHRKRGWFCSEAAATVIGLPAAHRYDLVLLESVCARLGQRVQ